MTTEKPGIQEALRNDSNPLISVIIPVYNTERYLAYCLDSVINQTYQNLQIILVNDGSTDNSLQIAQQYADRDRRIRILNQENQGVSAARNLGISRAKGEYIGFVDSDDWIAPDLYQHLFSLIHLYNADISEAEIIRTANEGIRKTPEETQINIYTQQEYLKRFFKIQSQETVYYAYNKLYQRNVLINDQFPSYKVGEDVVSTFRAALRSGRIVSSNAPLYYYRQGSGITSRFNEHYYQLIHVWDDVYNLAKQASGQYQEWADINRKRIRLTILSELAISGEYNKEKHRHNREQLLQELRQNKADLLKAPMARSRKLLLLMFMINDRLTARLMHRFVKRSQ